MQLFFCLDLCLPWAGSAFVLPGTGCVVVNIGGQLGQIEEHLENW